MSLIYTAMDIGSNTIKIVVAEKYNNNFNVIANTMTPSEGIKNGEIEVRHKNNKNNSLYTSK